ncbi:MAG: T9SS type A sorting domain-containing protein [Saprospiraceae bacterium]|nr:T9SS type A sorting domain-containing protein [Saprospiraceae bacterium]
MTYEFIDDSPLLGINYYRIKQTDFDGQYSYTEIKSVRHRGTASVTISPRSTEGRLDITTAMEDYSMVVYNGGGQEVQRFDVLSGDQSVSIDALQAGIYFIKVTNGSESETLRIVKF